VRRIRVAIDGPAGAGKSTVARRLADRLGYVLVDTGALYRTVALAAKLQGIRWDDEATVGAMAWRLIEARQIVLERVAVDAAQGAGGTDSSRGAQGGSGVRVLLAGDDVSDAIRAPDMSLGASRVSAFPAVRKALLDAQRQAGAEGGVVLEGRDIGTVVFPDAEVKFFLTASAEVRAQRRYEELSTRGTAVTYEATLEDVNRRDKADTDRPVAPLRQAEDAIRIDSSGEAIDGIVDEMVRVVEERAAALG
jgi:cytidylate kinase